MNDDIRKVIVRQAFADAISHSEEFPGERIEGDWDSEAYQLAAIKIKLNSDDRDEGWDVYRDSLHTSVNLLLPFLEKHFANNSEK